MDRKEMSERLLQELKPELDRQWAEHERFMNLIANSAKSDEEKKSFEKYLRERALGRKKRPFPFMGVGILFAAVIFTIIVISWLR